MVAQRSWQEYGNAAIRQLYPTLRDGVDYVWGTRDAATPKSLLYKGPFIYIENAVVQALATSLMGMDPYNDYTTLPPTRPRIDSLVPNSAVEGSAAITMRVLGANFAVGASILFNNGAETTTRVSANEVTTGVDPTTASGKHVIPVQVSNAGAVSNMVPFAFT